MTPLRQLLTLVLLLIGAPLFASDYTAPRTGPAAYSQLGGRVASNGIDYLVAWPMGPPALSSIYTAVVRADGSPASVALSVDASTPGQGFYSPQNNPHGVSVTAGRDGYFLSWVSDEGLSAAITDSFGRVEHRVTVPTDNKGSTLAAWNGVASLVVTTSGGPFSATLFDNNGDPVLKNVPLGDTHGDHVLLSLTADSTGFLLLSTKSAGDHQDLYGRRISPSGAPGEWFLIRSIAGGVSGLAAASEGSHDVIAWGNGFGIWTLEVDSQTNGAATAKQLLPDPSTVTKVLIAGGRIWIAYEQMNAYANYAITIGSDGSQTAPLLIGGGPDSQIIDSDLASNGTQLLFTGSGFNGSDPAYVLRARFLAAGSVDAPFDVAKTLTDQEDGNLAAGLNQVLAVWDEKLTSGRQIFAARSDASRGSLDPAGIQITDSGTNINPAAAFNGTNYLVIWHHQTGTNHWQVVGRRLGPDGTILDSADIVIGDGMNGGTARVASDGTSWLVLATRPISQTGCGNTGSAQRLFAFRVSSAGALLDGGGDIVRSSHSEDEGQPDLAWTGSRYVVTWTSYCAGFHQPYFSAITAAIVSPDLADIRTARVSLQGAAWWGPQRNTYAGAARLYLQQF